jgi:hypothetical protein
MLRRTLLAASCALIASPALAKGAPKSMAKPIFKPRLIALDPGHGGPDPGALGVSGTQEKGVVMRVARELQAQLLQGGKYRVMLTRSTDSFVPLRERVARAQEAKADLFLSIHADSHPDPYVRGASVYTLSEDASDREAAALAARENRADSVVSKLVAQPDLVAKTLVAMTQRGTGLSARAASACCRIRTERQASLSLQPPTFPPAWSSSGICPIPRTRSCSPSTSTRWRLPGRCADRSTRTSAWRPVPRRKPETPQERRKCGSSFLLEG